MNTISTLAKGSLKSNKSKSILIAITIMLTTTLLASVGLTCINWIAANKAVTIERSGSFHAIYKRADPKEISVIKENINIEKYGLLKTVAFSELDENSLGIIYIDENTKEMNNVKFEEGAMPKALNEIAIESEYLDLIGENIKVGEKVKLSYESALNEGEKEKEFIVSGILDTSEVNKAQKRYSAIISEEFLKAEGTSSDITFNLYMRVKNEKSMSGNDIEYLAKKTATDIGISEYDVKLNEDYINATNPDPAVVGGGIGIALVVVFSSMLVIYSIFYVSVINKVQEYGKLRAIGATKKQIKKLILKEGFVLSTISIPLGLILGYLISDLVIIKLIGLDKYVSNTFNLPIMTIVLVVSYITVFMSLIKPMKMASKVSPVEAIRFNGETEEKKKDRNGYMEINIKKLTYANISRNKKRTAITLVSLAVSGILFITMSTVLSSIDAKNMVIDHMPGDFSLSLSNYNYGNNESNEADINIIQINNPLGKDVRDKILATPGVEDIIINKSVRTKYILPNGDEISASIDGFNDERYKELEENLVEGEINKETLDNGTGVIYTYPHFAEESGIKVGNKVKLSIFNGKETIEKEFTVEAISYVGGEEFLIPNKVMNEIVTIDATNNIQIIVGDKKIEEVKEVVKAIADGNGFIELGIQEEQIKIYEQSISMTKTLGYALVIIIGVIGFMNLINTMITSIITRKKELGMLQAIGLSNKQLVRMLQIEGLFYTGGTLLITLTLGNVIGYIAFLLFKNSGASYAVYSYPLIQTIIMVLAITLAQIIITYMVSNNFNKQSLVDRVRYSE